MDRHLFTAILSLIVFYGTCFAGTPAEDAASTVVIYNLNDPDSKGLADFYCQARGIEPGQEIGISAPVTEEISRTDYDLMIADPLRAEMQQRGYWIVTRDDSGANIVSASRIHYAVLIRGVPLKIAPYTNYPGDNPNLQPAPFGSCNAASVDSEISVLGLWAKQISGILVNPLCENRPGKGIATNTPAIAAGTQKPPCLLMVGRLDAPSAEAVRTMIRNALQAEKDGLWGCGYIDLRSITDPGYIVGDQWIKKAGEAMRKHGIPVISDDLPDIFQNGFPITQASAYFGWYAENIGGPFANPAFEFMPGAVAAHLHSFSATTLHDPAKGWTGPLMLHGASASVGNVYEPYLIFTTDFGTMEEKLLSGHNLAESYYAAQPVLSWMSLLLGDPLYRPYAALQSNGSAAIIWSDYRDIILSHHGNVLKAAHDLGARAHEKGESLYLEALGAAQSDAGSLLAAGASFHDAAELAKDPQVQFRLLLEQARVFEKRGMPEKGTALLGHGLLQFTNQDQRNLILAWIQRLEPIQTPAPGASPRGSNSAP
jgi:uncharacterized protein (TIGR03790 family)